MLAGVLATAVLCTTMMQLNVSTVFAAKKTKAEKIAGSTYTKKDLIWEDHFDGDTLNTQYWNYEAHEPGWVNAEWQSYPDEETNKKTGNIYVKDGKLTIQAKKTVAEDGSVSYTSGRINTQNKVDTKYGRFEARIKMPSGKGFLPAFWLMPTDENLYGQWPKCGEIDIAEVLGDKTDTTHATLHFGEPHTQRQGTYTLKNGDFSKEFHVYACEWEPGEIRYYLDGELFYTENDWFTKREGFDEVTYPAPFDQPFYIILNLAVGGTWVGYPDDTTVFDERAQMVVDYVKVYQKDSYNENVKKPENKVKLRKPDKNNNYVKNSNFSKKEKLNDGKNWEFLLAGEGDASAKIENKALHIDTKNAGELDYSVQVVQANIPFEKGYQYALSFDAYADENRTMITGITAPDNGYIRYMNDTKVELTTKKKTYRYTFDMTAASDANGRVEFNLGNQSSVASVHITNVKVEKIKKLSLTEEKTVRPDGNYVYNGAFQEGADRLSYWTIKKTKGTTAKVTNKNNIRQLKVKVTKDAKNESDVAVKQTKLALRGKKTYVLSFDAKRTGAKNQKMKVKIAGQTFTANLTSKMTNYKFEFQPKAGTKSATLAFLLGTKGTTYLDNVCIMETGLLINGDFSAGLTGFEAWANNASDISYVVDTLKEDSAFCMDIKNTGDQDWHIQLKQTGVKLEKNQTYKISFRAKSDLERDIKFAFQRNGLKRKTADGAEDWTVYFAEEQIPLTKDWKTYEYIFTMPEADDADTSMSFNFGAIAGKQIAEKHTVCLDDIVLEKTDEKATETTTSASGGGSYSGSSSGGSTPTVPNLTASVNTWTLPNNAMVIAERTVSGVTYKISDLSGAQDSVAQEIPTSIAVSEVSAYDSYRFQASLTANVAKTVTVKAMKGNAVIKSTEVSLTAGAPQTVTLDLSGAEILAAPASLYSLRAAEMRSAGNTQNISIVIEMGKHANDDYTGADNENGASLVQINLRNASLCDTSNKKAIPVGSWYVYAEKSSNEEENAKGYIEKADVSGKVKLTVKNISTASEGWRATYESKGLDWSSGYSLEAGVYQFAVNAKADKAWNMELMFGDPVDDAKSYGSERVTLGTEDATKVATFTLTQPAKVKLMIKLANIADANGANENSGDVEIVINQVKLTKVASYEASVVPPQGDGNQNTPEAGENPEGGETQPASAHVITISEVSVKEVTEGAIELLNSVPSADTWSQYVHLGEGNADGSIQFENGVAIADILAMGSADWQVQVKSPTIAFEAGKTYTISFKIKSTMDRNIKIAIMADGDQWYGGATVTLQANNETIVTKQITLLAMDESHTNAPSILQFSMGLVTDEM